MDLKDIICFFLQIFSLFLQVIKRSSGAFKAGSNIRSDVKNRVINISHTRQDLININIPRLFSLIFTVVMINLVKIMKIFIWNQGLHLICYSFIFLSCSLENRARNPVGCCYKQIHLLASTKKTKIIIISVQNYITSRSNSIEGKSNNHLGRYRFLRNKEFAGILVVMINTNSVFKRQLSDLFNRFEAEVVCLKFISQTCGLCINFCVTYHTPEEN